MPDDSSSTVATTRRHRRRQLRVVVDRALVRRSMDAAGGMRALARSLDVANPTVISWLRHGLARPHHIAAMQRLLTGAAAPLPAWPPPQTPMHQLPPVRCSTPCSDGVCHWSKDNTSDQHRGVCRPGMVWCRQHTCLRALPWPLLPLSLMGRACYAAHRLDDVRDHLHHLDDLVPAIGPDELPLLAAWARHLSDQDVPWVICSAQADAFWPLALYRVITSTLDF